MVNRLFRTKLFGGYSKEDVQNYVSKLEEEIAKLQNQFHEKFPVSSEPADSLQQKKTDAEEDVFVLGEMTAVGKITELAMSVEQQKELAETRLELEKVKRELKDAVAQLESKTQMNEKNETRLKTITAEKKKLEDEVQQLREEKRNYDEDYSAIKEVLLNAKINAEIITTRARKEAEHLLENTQRQIEDQKKEAVTELMRNLAENYNGLQISKHYTEEQIRNIDRMEKQIKSIQSKMECLLEADADSKEKGNDKSV